MPSILRFLEDRDSGYLRIVAEMAGLEAPDLPREQLAAWLAAALFEPDQLQEQLQALSDGARAALDHLLQHAGRIPFADFTRQFGPMREIGPARRDRERIWRHPASPLEELWYQAYIGRAFFDTPSGPQEFACLPDELFAALGAPSALARAAMGRPAETPARIEAASSALVDDATTLLAARRRHAGRRAGLAELSERKRSHLHFPAAVPLLEALLVEAQILDNETRQPRSAPARDFLYAPRPDALRQLLLTWRASRAWNDLAAVEGLFSSKDGWPNDPIHTRQAALDLLAGIPADAWWELAALLEDVRREHPGFQRPAGDFDSWYFQDEQGTILHGLDAWPRVEGALLRTMLGRTLHWLGAVDLGLDPAGHVAAFRLTPASPLLFDHQAEIEIQAPPGAVEISGDGSVRFARSASRALRYQIARFADWGPADEQHYTYTISPAAMRRAADQGLQVRQVSTLLEETGASMPPGLAAALDRYARSGMEARIERLCVLRTETAAVMDELRSNRATRRYIKEALTPQLALVPEGQVERLTAEALRAGLLLDSFSIEADIDRA